MTPKVSIGLVTRNRANILPRAIESVLKQSFTDYEIIISDDNSHDDTRAVAEKYLSDSRIRYVRRNGIGMTQNFLQTLLDAKGEYFLWLCDDDLISENYLQTCVQFLSGHHDYSLVCGKTVFVKENVVQDMEQSLELEQDTGYERVLQYFRHVNSNIILYGLMRTASIKNLLYPDTFGADLLWSTQLVFQGKIRILKSASFYYSISGISNDTSNLQNYYATTRARKGNPYRVLRNELITMIRNPTTVFSTLSFLQRTKMIVPLWIIFRERFLMPRVEARLRGLLKIRTRIKAIFR